MKLALLNTTIATTDGDYEVRSITPAEALSLVCQAEELDSAIGHESTAQIMSVVLQQSVEVNRQVFSQQVGQKAIVFKLKGRAPEGVILDANQIEEIGYVWKLMTRTA